MTAVDEHEYIHEIFAFAQVVFDHLCPLPAFRLRYFGKAITGKVYEIPRQVIGIFYNEMIDELRFAGSAGSFGQLMVIGDHIDERRFAHIAAADKCILGPVGFGTLGIVGAGNEV